jgi:hypothetical protein
MDDGVVGTILEFTGFVTVTTGQMFTVTHDDGLTLIIGGLDLGFNPGPTAPVTSIATYTGPSGTFAFQLVYAECCGGPAVLQIDLPFSNVAPEPATLALRAWSRGSRLRAPQVELSEAFVQQPRPRGGVFCSSPIA